MTDKKPNLFNEQAKILVKAGIFDLIEARAKLEAQVQEINTHIQQKLLELKKMEEFKHDGTD
jgi:SAM-dependent MidA family methyltransferase